MVGAFVTRRAAVTALAAEAGADLRIVDAGVRAAAAAARATG